MAIGHGYAGAREVKTVAGCVELRAAGTHRSADTSLVSALLRYLRRSPKVGAVLPQL